MHQGDLWIQENAARHARDERMRVHLHHQALRQAEHGNRGANVVRRRLGVAMVRLGHRVAGEGFGSPALTA
jgi:hypothetical protein